MKKMKNVILYGTIILLCIAAFAGYSFSRKTPAADSTANNSTIILNLEKNETAVVTPGDKKETTAKSEVETLKLQNDKKATLKIEPMILKSVDKKEVSGKAKAPAVMLKDGNNITGKSNAERQKHVKEVMKNALKPIDANPVVGIGRGTDYGKVTAEAIKNAGGMKDLIKKGDIVLIKPNVCTVDFSETSTIITDYRVVQEVVNEAYNNGAGRVIIAEGGFSGNTFEVDSNKYKTLKGVELFNFNSCEKKDCYELKPEKSLVGKALFIPKIYMDADVVINIAKLKTHFMTNVTLSLKNSIGIPSEKIYGGSGDKIGLHNLGLDEVIIDLNKIRKPDLAIIDGIVGGQGNGPVNCEPVKSNVVFAGRDLVALDTVGLNFMGFKVKWITHVVSATKEKMGISDLSKIKINGADLDSIKMDFFSLEKLVLIDADKQKK